MAAPPPDAEFHLIYWPSIPGRGEHVRLALEEAGISYRDTAQQDDGMELVQSLLGADHGDARNPPLYAPPALRHGDLLISQTPNILLYLADLFASSLLPQAQGHGAAAAAKYHVNALALTALDGLSNEPHDCHHPIAVGLYYEDQKQEALRRSQDYVRNRLPRFLAHFQRVLSSPSSGDGPWLYAGQFSYADLVLYQCLDGVAFQFPRAMDKARSSGKYDAVFSLHIAVRERPRIKAYLASHRRQKYSLGIYRHYAELDVE